MADVPRSVEEPGRTRRRSGMVTRARRTRRPEASELDPERRRLAEAGQGGVPWRRWGPYLADRQWGTVREDYSGDGAAGASFPHDHARSRAYRWNEDGLLGISDDEGRLCFALALWNGADPILKERLFGLSNAEGNHGEDVKEYYFYLDNTPTHSYMRALYKYPQPAFPYAGLVEENGRRGRDAPEYELVETCVFAEGRYFDVEVEYGKAGPEDVMVRLRATNRGPDAAALHLLPTLWYRNSWSWGRDPRRPELRAVDARTVRARHEELGEYWLHCDGSPELLFTENETNAERLWGAPNRTPFVKDGVDRAVVRGEAGAVNPERVGTKAAAHYAPTIGAGGSATLCLRLSARRHGAPFEGAEALFVTRRDEADAFYRPLGGPGLSEDARAVQRQAFAGLLWSKQFYHYDVDEWLQGDPAGPPPPPARRRGRNHEWPHLNCHEVLSMPDAWEYPYFAAWDLAFHCVPLALVDGGLDKEQLRLMVREW